MSKKDKKETTLKNQNAAKLFDSMMGLKDTKPDKKKMGGTVKKMNMGGVLKNRGGTYKGTY
jgi:hypothetical protein